MLKWLESLLRPGEVAVTWAPPAAKPAPVHPAALPTTSAGSTRASGPTVLSEKPTAAPEKPKCKRCGTEVFREHEFLQASKEAGLHVDEQGRVALRLGNLAGDMNSIATGMKRQQAEQQAKFDRLEQLKGFQCKNCKSVYCMNCLFNFAPPHPRGGKGCPACGGTFQLFT